MPTLMDAATDLDRGDRRNQAIIDGIGKSVQKRTPQFAIGGRADLRHLLDHLDDGVHVREELIAEPAS